MKIIITGGTGLLGKSLIETQNFSTEITATYIGAYTMEDRFGIKYIKLDIRDSEGYERLFREIKPDVVVHTAGVGSPDYAELHRKETWEINVGGTMNVLSLCREYQSKLVFISSNGIYDGEKAPYGEEDEPKPINYYGELKFEVEKNLKNCSIPCAIVRPILMYGWNHPFERPNIATYALSLMRQGSPVFVYDDVFVTPLYSRECGKAIWGIIEKGQYSVFNIAGAERTSIYQMIKKLAALYEFDDELVKPVKQGFFHELTKRPRDTSFKTGKMQALLGLRPLTLEEGFSRFKAESNR